MAAASRVGYPCVLKPLDGNHGRGVHLDLRNADAVRAAFPEALRQSRNGDVVVESYITGNDYRCLVIGGKVAAIAERVPASVVGRRGAHGPPARRDRERRPAPRHRPREGAHADQDRRSGRGARPRPGVRARRRPARGHAGQARADRQHVDRRHVDRPDDRGPPRQRRDRRDRGTDRRARRGRHRLHLPGHRDARPRDRRRRSSRSTPRPGSGCTPTRPRASRSTSPSPSSTRCSRPGTTARIPILAVTGTNGKTTTVRMIAHILKLMGRRVGMTSTDGIVVDGRLMKKGDMSGPKSALDGPPEPDRRHRRVRGRPRRHPP